MSLVIVDTECANLSSVVFACERLGVSPVTSDDPEVIISADRVILPGVGAAPYALAKIHEKNLFTLIQNLQQPLMGICLGMQLLFENLFEGGEKQRGLGLISGSVKQLDTKGLTSPHMGWNQLKIEKDSLLLDGLNSGDYAYFVHSFAAETSADTVASSQHGEVFSAVVAKNRVFGCQFHPERSSKVGSTILGNFLKIT